jgi:midasin
MVTFVTELAKAAANHSKFATKGAPWEFNLRDLLRWLDLVISQTGLERQAGNPMEFLDVLFLQRFRAIEDRQYVLELAEKVFEQSLDPTRPGCPQLGSRTSRIGRCLLERNNTPRSISTQPHICHYVQQTRALQAVAIALQAKSLAIIAGPEGTGKTRLVHLFASYAGQRVRTFCMNSQTDTLEMLGTFEQSSMNKTAYTYLDQLKSILDGYVSRASGQRHWQLCHQFQDSIRQITEAGTLSHVEDWISILTGLRTSVESANDTWALGLSTSLLAVLQNMIQVCGEQSFAGRFEWRDGALPQAMTSGDILHIENANFCSASVLDRLNALFEPQGKLVLTERGMVNGQIVEVLPDPAFRVIMTLDPRYGELSRAMRNRGIELALLKDTTHSPSLVKPSTSSYQGVQQIMLRSCITASPLPSSLEDAGTLDQASQVTQISSTPFTSSHARSRESRHTPTLSQVALALPLQTLQQNAHDNRRKALYSALLDAAQHTPLAPPVLFSQDSNDSLKQLDDETASTLAQIDGISRVQIEILSAGMALQIVQQQARQRAVRELNVVQQSYLALVAPSRLGQLDPGVETVYPLITGILSALLQATNARPMKDDVSDNLARDMEIAKQRYL